MSKAKMWHIFIFCHNLFKIEVLLQTKGILKTEVKIIVSIEISFELLKSCENESQFAFARQ